MGAPPAFTPLHGGPSQASTTLLSTQHERLILELLPFKNSVEFRQWLASGWVRGSWLEFSRDFLVKTRNAAEPDKATTAQAAKDAVNSRSQKFLVYHPEKTNWSAQDHYVRFIVTVIQDNMLRSLWSESEWKKKGLDVAKAVYEILCFLKSSYYLVDQHPPSYSPPQS